MEGVAVLLPNASQVLLVSRYNETQSTAVYQKLGGLPIVLNIDGRRH